MFLLVGSLALAVALYGAAAGEGTGSVSPAVGQGLVITEWARPTCLVGRPGGVRDDKRVIMHSPRVQRSPFPLKSPVIYVSHAAAHFGATPSWGGLLGCPLGRKNRPRSRRVAGSVTGQNDPDNSSDSWVLHHSL